VMVRLSQEVDCPLRLHGVIEEVAGS